MNSLALRLFIGVDLSVRLTSIIFLITAGLLVNTIILSATEIASAKSCVTIMALFFSFFKIL